MLALFLIHVYLITRAKGVRVSRRQLHKFLLSCFTIGWDSKWCVLEGEYSVTLVYCCCFLFICLFVCFWWEFAQRKCCENNGQRLWQDTDKFTPQNLAFPKVGVRRKGVFSPDSRRYCLCWPCSGHSALWTDSFRVLYWHQRRHSVALDQSRRVVTKTIFGPP